MKKGREKTALFAYTVTLLLLAKYGHIPKGQRAAQNHATKTTS